MGISAETNAVAVSTITAAGASSAIFGASDASGALSPGMDDQDLWLLVWKRELLWLLYSFASECSSSAKVRAVTRWRVRAQMDNQAPAAEPDSMPAVSQEALTRLTKF